MGSFTIDMITRNLSETIDNMDYLERDGFTDFLATILQDVFYAVREIAAEIIESGEPSSEIPSNVGGYARKKARGEMLYSYDRGMWIAGYGSISHGLGILTGDLYNGVSNQQLGSISVTRGREVRLGTTFNNPSYIGDVHDGKPGTLPRPFMDVASRRVEEVLTEVIEEYLKDLEIVSPPPQFISSLISRSILGDLVVY